MQGKAQRYSASPPGSCFLLLFYIPEVTAFGLTPGLTALSLPGSGRTSRRTEDDGRRMEDGGRITEGLWKKVVFLVLIFYHGLLNHRLKGGTGRGKSRGTIRAPRSNMDEKFQGRITRDLGLTTGAIQNTPYQCHTANQMKSSGARKWDPCRIQESLSMGIASS